MARAVYSHELTDPDFAWLVASYMDNNPSQVLIDLPGLPLVFIAGDQSLQDELADNHPSSKSKETGAFFKS